MQVTKALFSPIVPAVPRFCTLLQNKAIIIERNSDTEGKLKSSLLVLVNSQFFNYICKQANNLLVFLLGIIPNYIYNISNTYQPS
jgi:hypothetical protein